MDFNSETKMKDIALSNPPTRQVQEYAALSSECTPPGDACTSFKALYEALREFEADLRQHVHLENNVLLLRAVELEASAHEGV